MNSFLKKAQEAIQQVAESHGQDNRDSGANPSSAAGGGGGGGKSLHLPTPVVEWIDKYVDTFSPAISKQVSDEITVFQDATLQSLEEHIKAVFQAVFRGDFSAFQSANNIAEFRAAREHPQQGTGLPNYSYPTPQNKPGERALPDYGTRGLPFAGDLLASFNNLQVNPNPNPEAPHQERNIFQNAVSKVSDFAKSSNIEGEFGMKIAKVAHTIDELNIDPLEKAKQVAPELREKVARVLTDLHAPLADKLTHLALTQVKNFLKGNISIGELGEGLMGSLGGLFHKSSGNSGGGGSRAIGESGSGAEVPGGFVGLLSEKLSKGLTVIRARTREDFRDVLGKIEEALFDSLPKEVSGPLIKVLGGNPFSDDDDQRQQSRGDRGFNVLEEVKDKIKTIVERIQKGLRDRVLEVVSGGHRKASLLCLWFELDQVA
ncbi:hypothetical protein V5O48_003049 [Marasmius crinis-equi]|uniref:Uncharacterized protein n=1 Tax=Marasmius crinis-equi TaxID=585013 RepID=A0ABR3FTY4_9AGAR